MENPPIRRFLPWLFMTLPLLVALLAGRPGGETGPSFPEDGKGRKLRGADRIPPLIADRVAALETKGKAKVSGRKLRFHEGIKDFYDRRGHKPAWIVHGRYALPAAWELLDAVNKADLEGLEPREYHLHALDSLLPVFGRRFSFRAGPAPEAAATLDLLLTDAYLRLGSHLLAGRVHPISLADQWHISDEKINLSEYLDSALAGDEVRASLQRLAPTEREYGIMKHWLAAYRDVQSQGGWPAISRGGGLAPGDTGKRVLQLCGRLAAAGEIAEEDLEEGRCGVRYDSALAAGVRRFQGHHGLAATGKVDEATLRELNATVEDRIDQIRLGLECWRWLPRELGERHVRVNIADFSLTAWEGRRAALAMRVVVGKKEDSTPVFSDRIVSVSLNPPWNVPETIAKEEILPELQTDPTYLERQGMELLAGWSENAAVLSPDTIDWAEMTPETFKFRIRQKHGDGSALGKVKFVLTNPFNIYLHDTPSKSYFARHRRALSHGCVRVERPVDLAEWILAPEWTKSSLLKEIGKGEPVMVPASGKGVPVHILYWTAFADPEGGLQFRRDIYGWGKRMEKDLDKTARL